MAQLVSVQLQSYPSEDKVVVYPAGYWKDLLLSTHTNCAQSVSRRDLMGMD